MTSPPSSSAASSSPIPAAPAHTLRAFTIPNLQRIAFFACRSPRSTVRLSLVSLIFRETLVEYKVARMIWVRELEKEEKENNNNNNNSTSSALTGSIKSGQNNSFKRKLQYLVFRACGPAPSSQPLFLMWVLLLCLGKTQLQDYFLWHKKPSIPAKFIGQDGVNPSSKYGAEEISPLYVAIFNKREKIVEMLIEFVIQKLDKTLEPEVKHNLFYCHETELVQEELAKSRNRNLEMILLRQLCYFKKKNHNPILRENNDDDDDDDDNDKNSEKIMRAPPLQNPTLYYKDLVISLVNSDVPTCKVFLDKLKAISVQYISGATENLLILDLFEEFSDSDNQFIFFDFLIRSSPDMINFFFDTYEALVPGGVQKLLCTKREKIYEFTTNTMLLACQTGCFDMVRIILERAKAGGYLKNQLECHNQYYVTPLYHATKRGDVRIAKMLMAHASDQAHCNALADRQDCMGKDSPRTMTSTAATATGIFHIHHVMLSHKSWTLSREWWENELKNEEESKQKQK